MKPRTIQARRHRQSGSAAILAMMFLVIFGSLSAAMAIVAQGNLATADSHMKINRAMAAAETGTRFLMYRLNQVTVNVTTRAGVIDSTKAAALWTTTRTALFNSLNNEYHNAVQPVVNGTKLTIGPINLSANGQKFTATMTPHPLAGENYDSAYYQRPPYNTMIPPVTAAAPLDATWIRVRVESTDGATGHAITRAIQMDFKMDKKIHYAILSRSRVMIGRNVMIEGPIGSRFMETDLENGHPVHMESDFNGLNLTLDGNLDTLKGYLITNDKNGDNRLTVSNPEEITDIVNPEELDTNGDGYIDDYDYFLAHYDTAAKGYVTAIDLNTAGNPVTDQLLELIDTFGDPTRPGYNDGIIDNDDNYAKIRGQILITASKNSWETGAAKNDDGSQGNYQNYFEGPIVPDHNKAPLTFEASENNVQQFTPSDFDVSTFRNMTASTLTTQAAAQAALYDPSNPNSPKPLGTTVTEAVPFAAAHPYDYYTRPIYENMTFTNVKISKGSNALFKNCKFIGVTFVETETGNTDINYNYAGMVEADGTQKHPDKAVVIGGNTIADTKTISNNIRFHGCTFEGAIVSDAPLEFSHVRNKIAFTGTTQFHIDDSVNLTSTEKALFKRSTILSPHYSVEMGTFISPYDNTETVRLSGTIVAGVLDMRGQVKINGTILTTFEPQSGAGPVLGETSPQFNTTLGYFSAASGDLEAELPVGGIGVIQVRYDPTIPLPDGILGPIEIAPDYGTYYETGA